MTKISIIGGTGKMGSAFAEALKKKGHDVIISSRSTEIKPIDAAKQGNIVIISVPIKSTEEVIKELAPFTKKDTILTDFTSVKVKPCKLMEKYSKSNVIGGHPLFGPGVNLSGQQMVLCNIKGDKLKELKSIYESIGLNIIELSAEQHDKEMAVIQCLNQFDNLSFADFLLKNKFSLNENKEFTPNFKLKLSVIGRTLSQPAGLYPEILMENQYSKEIISDYIKSLEEIQKLINDKNEEALESKVIELQKYFGSLTQESRILTNEILNKMENK